MKLNHLLGLAMLTFASSVAFVSCNKDDKKKNEEPVIINQSKDYGKELVGNYQGIIEVSAHGVTTQTKVVIKVKAMSKNVIALDIPSFAGRRDMMVKAFTLPNVKVLKKEDAYLLAAPKQVVPMTMGGSFPDSEITGTGTVDKNNILSMSLIWNPLPNYTVQLSLKDAKRVMK